jgi:hypothetical protein
VVAARSPVFTMLRLSTVTPNPKGVEFKPEHVLWATFVDPLGRNQFLLARILLVNHFTMGKSYIRKSKKLLF